MLRFGSFAIALLCGALLAPGASAAGALPLTGLDETPLPASGWGEYLPQLSHDASGTALAVWADDSGRIVSAQRRVGTTQFGAPSTVLDPTDPSTPWSPWFGPYLAGDDAGNATAVWLTHANQIAVATRRAGEPTFARPALLAADDPFADGLHVAMGTDGSTVVAWRSSHPESRLRAAVRPSPGQPFGPVADISAPLIHQEIEFASAPDGGVVIGLRRYRSQSDDTQIAEVVRRLPGAGAFDAALEVGTAPMAEHLGVPQVAIASGGTISVLGGPVKTTPLQLLTADPGRGFDRHCAAHGVHALTADSAGNVVGATILNGLRGTLHLQTKLAGRSCFDLGSNLQLPPGQNGMSVSLAADRAGGVHVQWLEQSRTPENAPLVLRYALRSAVPSGSGFSTIDPKLTQDPSVGPTVTLTTPITTDPFGNATVSWAQNGRQRSTLIDRGAPRITAIDMPNEVVDDVPAGFSLQATDDYSAPVAVRWAFGDGTTAEGAALSHADLRKGQLPLTVTATATDAAGNSAVVTRTVPHRLTPRLTAPTALKLGLSRSSFRAASSGAPLDGAAVSKRKRIGSAFTLRSAAAGTAHFTLERLVPGRKAGGRCRSGARRGRKCTAVVSVGPVFDLDVPAGKSAWRLTGRWADKRLKAGNYRLTAALRAGALTSPPTVVRFKIRR